MERFSDVIPRFVICVLGNWDNFDSIHEVVNKAGFEFDDEFSSLGNDDRMFDSFTASADRVDYSIKEGEWTAIREHKAVGYFVSPVAESDADMKHIAGKALVLIKYLFSDLGAVALKCESSGIAHGRDRWIDLSEKYAQNNDLKYLYSAFVRRPLESEYGIQSCGMHLLGLQDILYFSVDRTELEAVSDLDQIADIIISCDGEYELIETKMDKSDVNANQTRSIPCQFYEEDSFFFNPYGYVYVDGDMED